jgi:LysM repeat protein
MAARSPLRFLAPVAVVVVIVAAVVVVASSDGGKDHKDSARTATTQQKLPKRHTYVVRVGDTLDAISERFGVPSARLIALNPGLDPQALQLGDRIKLRP